MIEQNTYTRINFDHQYNVYEVRRNGVPIGTVVKRRIGRRHKWLGYFINDNIDNDPAKTDASTRYSCADQLYDLVRVDDGYFFRREHGIKFFNLSETAPKSFVITFDVQAVREERIKAMEAVEYWLNAKCISQFASQAVISWSKDNTELHVVADFMSGYFGGDMTYHNAILFGDEKFTIGLMSLLYSGHRTSKRYIEPVGITVQSVQLFYNKLGKRVASIEETITTMPDYKNLDGRIARVEKSLKRLKLALTTFNP